MKNRKERERNEEGRRRGGGGKEEGRRREGEREEEGRRKRVERRVRREDECFRATTFLPFFVGLVQITALD